MIGIIDKGWRLIKNHISPDARFILICTHGLKIYKFKKEETEELPKIVLEETDWTLPIKTDDIEPLELARRVRFEANNIIRILTKENRDILYELVPN